jgi:FKBP-type peptidyl-prolyl cis-trans isomerase
MTLKITMKWMAVLAVGLLAAQASAQETPTLKTQKDKISYAIGADLGRNIKRQGGEVNAEALMNGMRDAFSADKLLMTDEDIRAALNAFQVELKQRRARPAGIVAEDNRKAGETFLAGNKTKEGVVTLPSGLQYKILKEGDGKKPAEADTVEVNYRGILLDGTEFDSSHVRGQAAVFRVAEVIPGWRETLKLMPVGSRWQIFIPSQLAYGEQGSGRYIEPNATLIFELELLAIK